MKEITQTQQKQLSENQKRFQKLLKDIEMKKNLIEKLEKNFAELQVLINQEIKPLANIYKKKSLDKLLRIDEVLEEIKISNRKRTIVEEYLKEKLIDLMPIIENLNNEKYNVLLNKYIREEDLEEDNEEEFFDMFEEFRNNNFGNDGFFDFGFEKEPKKKSKSQIKKEKEEEENKKLMAIDTKSIYYKLVKKFHPDKQQDESQKENFTQITQEVTKAYKENDFQKLIELQVTLLADEDKIMDEYGDETLKRFIKALNAQILEYNQKINSIKMGNYQLTNFFMTNTFDISTVKVKSQKNEINGDIKGIDLSIEYSYLFKKKWIEEIVEEIEYKNRMNSIFGL